MSLRNREWLMPVVFCLLVLLLAQCKPESGMANPVWLTRLDPGGHYSYKEPSWSPNSKQVVYTRREVPTSEPAYAPSSSSEIFIMNVATQEVQQLTDNNFYDFAPTWAPDGQRIAYIREEALYAAQPENDIVTSTIQVVAVNGVGGSKAIACPYSCGWLTWSPVGDRFAFQMQLIKNATNATKNIPPPEIFTINLDGSNLVQITRGNSPAYAPQWSPDGKRIVFLRSSDEPIRIVDIESQIETAYEVGDLIGVSDPSWSPDQSEIVFSASRPERSVPQLYVLSLNDRSIAPLFSNASDTSGRFMYGAKWSPDGTKLIFDELGTNLYLVDAIAAGLLK
jgi:Tol biopolymer transport system component